MQCYRTPEGLRCVLTGGVLESGLATTLLIRGTLSHLVNMCPSIYFSKYCDSSLLCPQMLLTLKASLWAPPTHARSTVQGSYFGMSRVFRDQPRPMPVKRLLL